MIPKPIATAIIVVVTLVWAGNVAAAVFMPDYQPDTVLNFVFMAVVGSALAARQDGTGAVMARIITAIRPAPPSPTPPPTPPEDQTP